LNKELSLDNNIILSLNILNLLIIRKTSIQESFFTSFSFIESSSIQVHEFLIIEDYKSLIIYNNIEDIKNSSINLDFFNIEKSISFEDFLNKDIYYDIEFEKIDDYDCFLDQCNLFFSDFKKSLFKNQIIRFQ